MSSTTRTKSRARLGAESPYLILGLTDPRSSRCTYTDADIARAYRRASLLAHPDKPNGSQELFERIREAFLLLETEEKRKLHQQYGARLAPGPGEALSSAVDLLVPLSIGWMGGIVVVVVRQSKGAMVWVASVSLLCGALSGSKSPLPTVLWTGMGGMVVGVGLGTSVVALGSLMGRKR